MRGCPGGRRQGAKLRQDGLHTDSPSSLRAAVSAKETSAVQCSLATARSRRRSAWRERVSHVAVEKDAGSANRPTVGPLGSRMLGERSFRLASPENAGRLADLDQVPVGIADIRADLAPVVLRLGEELDALGRTAWTSLILRSSARFASAFNQVSRSNIPPNRRRPSPICTGSR